jgi:hypothetical protein
MVTVLGVETHPFPSSIDPGRDVLDDTPGSFAKKPVHATMGIERESHSHVADSFDFANNSGLT